MWVFSFHRIYNFINFIYCLYHMFNFYYIYLYKMHKKHTTLITNSNYRIFLVLFILHSYIFPYFPSGFLHSMMKWHKTSLMTLWKHWKPRNVKIFQQHRQRWPLAEIIGNWKSKQSKPQSSHCTCECGLLEVAFIWKEQMQQILLVH